MTFILPKVVWSVLNLPTSSLLRAQTKTLCSRRGISSSCNIRNSGVGRVTTRTFPSCVVQVQQQRMDNNIIPSSMYSSSSSVRSMSSSSSSSSPSSELIGKNVTLAMDTLVTCDCVCFDVDSTVIQEEGIDVLASYLNKYQQVQEVTKMAMEGGLPFQDALHYRLELLQPSKPQIERCMERHPFQFSPNIIEFITLLQSLKKEVYFISGGFRIMIEPIAQKCNIPKSNIIANTIQFDMDGLYDGFDTTEFTARDMGKPKAVQSIIDQMNETTTTKKKDVQVIMIGDGFTDSQAKPPATCFIGYGGVVVRESVKEVADLFVTDFQVLIEHLKQNHPQLQQ